jgi:hypothetical protein
VLACFTGGLRHRAAGDILAAFGTIRCPGSRFAYSRAIAAMRCRLGGSLMSLDSHTGYGEPAAAPLESRPVDVAGLRAAWGERIVTAAAISIAVLVVAVIAVLMGMT